MPKKKRTLKQKIQADLRHHAETPPIKTHSNEQTYSVENVTIPPVAKPLQTTIRKAIITNDYGYLRADLLKTTILTGFIVFIELSIQFFTKGV